MDSSSFVSAIILLVLVTDPLGNIPVFIGLLRQVDPARRQRIIVREVVFAFAILLFLPSSARRCCASCTSRTPPSASPAG